MVNTLLDTVLSRFQGVHQCGKEWQALCPNHQDRRSSLSITEAEDGRVLLYCHAGCQTEAIVEAVGLNMRDLFPGDNGKGDGSKQKRIVETYNYTDAVGDLVYQVVRYDPKDFRQRRPNGNGGWEWNLDGIQRVLYRLPNVIKAVSHRETIYIPEGERDVHTLESLGLTGTCNAGGAGKWQASYSESLRGANIIILPDNDKAGIDHAEMVAQSLSGLAASIKVVKLPGLKAKGDVTDWVRAGGSAEELLKLVSECPEWRPASPTAVVPVEHYPLTHTSDLANAERFKVRHGQNLRFVTDWKKWIVWNGVRWELDGNLEVERLAKDCVRSIYAEASREDSEKERKAIARWAEKSESADRISAMIRLAQSECTITSNQLDLDPMLLCVQNGVIDLRTGDLLTPRRDNYVTKQAAAAYDPEAKCDLWNRYLERVQPDKSVRKYLQKAVGYSLTGAVGEHCLFFCYGEGRNGKSVFAETILALLDEYGTKVSADSVMSRRFDREKSREVVDLAGSRFAVMSEISQGQKLDEGLIKDLTGGDTLRGRFLYSEAFTFKAGFKLLLYGNHKPTIRGKDEGIWSRIRLIPFPVLIPKPERDPALQEKLKEELPGILVWAVRGCLLWQAEGLEEPEAIADAVNEYRREQDALADFLADLCNFDRSATVTKKDLWAAYSAWAESSGQEYYETQRLFNEEIRSRPGIREGRGAGNAAIWRGIGLLDEDITLDKVTKVTEVIEKTVKSHHEELEEKVYVKSVTSVTKVTPTLGIDDPLPDICCVCGEPVQRYTPDGQPFCSIHCPDPDKGGCGNG